MCPPLSTLVVTGMGQYCSNLPQIQEWGVDMAQFSLSVVGVEHQLRPVRVFMVEAARVRQVAVEPQVADIGPRAFVVAVPLRLVSTYFLAELDK